MTTPATPAKRELQGFLIISNCLLVILNLFVIISMSDKFDRMCQVGTTSLAFAHAEPGSYSYSSTATPAETISMVKDADPESIVQWVNRKGVVMVAYVKVAPDDQQTCTTPDGVEHKRSEFKKK